MTPDRLALAAAAQATIASADLMQMASDGADVAVLDTSTIPQMADALKLTIETARDTGSIEADDYGAAILALHGVVSAFLEGWAG